MSRNWPTPLWIALGVAIAIVGGYQLSVGSAVLGALVPVLGEIVRRTEMKSLRIGLVEKQIEQLYAPMEQVARAMPDSAEGSGYVYKFKQHMDRELRSLHRHLARPRTLAAYDTPSTSDLDREWSLDLAKALLDDHREIVEEFQRLTSRYV